MHQTPDIKQLLLVASMFDIYSVLKSIDLRNDSSMSILEILMKLYTSRGIQILTKSKIPVSASKT